MVFIYGAPVLLSSYVSAWVTKRFPSLLVTYWTYLICLLRTSRCMLWRFSSPRTSIFVVDLLTPRSCLRYCRWTFSISLPSSTQTSKHQEPNISAMIPKPVKKTASSQTPKTTSTIKTQEDFLTECQHDIEKLTKVLENIHSHQQKQLIQLSQHQLDETKPTKTLIVTDSMGGQIRNRDLARRLRGQWGVGGSEMFFSHFNLS